jgi:hypothetical protein
VAGEVLDRADVAEHLRNALLQEPLERFALDGDEVRQGQHLTELTERIPLTGRETSQRNSSELKDVFGRARTETSELQGRNGRIDTASWILDAHSTPAQAQAAKRSHPLGVAA